MLQEINCEKRSLLLENLDFRAYTLFLVVNVMTSWTLVCIWNVLLLSAILFSVRLLNILKFSCWSLKSRPGKSNILALSDRIERKEKLMRTTVGKKMIQQKNIVKNISKDCIYDSKIFELWTTACGLSSSSLDYGYIRFQLVINRLICIVSPKHKLA